jgi:hypothetical protein
MSIPANNPSPKEHVKSHPCQSNLSLYNPRKSHIGPLNWRTSILINLNMARHKYFIGFLLIWSIIPASLSQTYDWGLSLGTSGLDAGAAVETDDQGNVYASHFSDSKTTIVSYDASGQLRWELGINGHGNEQVLALHVDPLGAVYATGTFHTSIVVDGNTLQGGNSREIFLFKLDNNGNYLWGFSITGAGEDHGFALDGDAAGNVYVTGSFNATNDFDPSASTADLTSIGQEDIFMASYKANGDFRWARRAGGFGFDYGNGIGVSPSGQVAVGGWITGTSDFDPIDSTSIVNGYGTDAFIVVYDTAGQYQWVRSIGGSGNDHGRDLALDANGGIYLTGEFEDTVDFDPDTSQYLLTSVGESDVFLAKFSPEGDFQWASRMGGPSYDRGIGLDVDSKGRSYISGVFRQTADFNPGSGTANLSSSGFSGSSYVAAYDTAGQYRWAFAYSVQSEGEKLSVNRFHSLYVIGNFAQSFDADPSTGTVTLTNHGNWDPYLVKYRDANNPTSISDQLNPHQGFLVYPNPSQGELYILANQDRPATRITTTIYDFQGKVVFSQKAPFSQTHLLDLQQLNPGIYLLRIRDGSGRLGMFRLAKQ